MTVNPLLDVDARLVIAHRGNRAHAPENTMVALREAVALGADALEFDVRVSGDGVPMVLHDASVERTTSGEGLLSGMSAAEAERLDAGARFPGFLGRGISIPRLEEVLDAFREVPLVIEVKEPAAAAPAERLIRKFGIEGTVVVGSADARVSDHFYRSGLPSCASTRDAMRLIPWALMGVSPARPSFNVLSITPRFHGAPIPVTRMARTARRHRIPTQVWTVNEPARARLLWEGGVSAIVTDDPAAMIRARSG